MRDPTEVRPEAKRPRLLLGTKPLAPPLRPPVEFRSPPTGVEIILALASDVGVGVFAPEPDVPLELNGLEGDDRMLGDRRSVDTLIAELLA